MSFRNEIIQSLQSIPPVPLVAVRLTRLLRDPEIGIGKLVETIKYDPGLTSQAVKMANSALLGSTTQVVTLRDALVRLGTERLLRLVIASAVQPALSEAVQGYCLDAGDLWRHCVAVGIAGEKIEKETGGENGDLAFTLGLLHDIGKLVMGSFIDSNASLIAREADNQIISFLDVEEKVLGIDHTEAGALMLEQWGFLEDFVDAVRWHHQPDNAESAQDLADLVHVADAIAMMLGIGLGNDGLSYNLSTESVRRLGLKVQRLEFLASQAFESLEEVMKMFGYK